MFCVIMRNYTGKKVLNTVTEIDLILCLKKKDAYRPSWMSASTLYLLISGLLADLGELF